MYVTNCSEVKFWGLKKMKAWETASISMVVYITNKVNSEFEERTENLRGILFLKEEKSTWQFLHFINLGSETQEGVKGSWRAWKCQSAKEFHNFFDKWRERNLLSLVSMLHASREKRRSWVSIILCLKVPFDIWNVAAVKPNWLQVFLFLFINVS